MTPDKRSETIRALLLSAICLYIISGGFYNILEKPTRYAFWRGNLYTIDPEMSSQTTSESLLSFTCNALTFSGLMITTLVGNRPRYTSNRFLLIGIGLTLIGLFGSCYLLELKMYPWYKAE